jgi:hypothetical protein
MRITYPSNKTSKPVTANWKACKSLNELNVKRRMVVAWVNVLNIPARASGTSASDLEWSIATAISFCGSRRRVSSAAPSLGRRTSNSPGPSHVSEKPLYM